MDYEEMLGKLSLEEKCVLLQGATTFGSRPNPRLGIPAITFSDGPNGLRHQPGAADHLGLNGSEPATCFPTAVTVSNSWDPELGEKIAGPVRRRSADAGLARQVGDGQRPVGAFRAAVEQPLHGSP